jgi:hypothetical protein
MIEFVLEPFVGPKPLRFGMSSYEVDAAIGPPDFVHQYLFEQRRPHVTLGFEPKQDYMWEAVFKEGANLVFHGHDLFAEPDLISFLQRYDPNRPLRMMQCISPTWVFGSWGLICAALQDFASRARVKKKLPS